LASGVDGYVKAFSVFDDGSGPALHAGGFFTSAGGVAANNIARWDGTSWSPLGSGVSAQTGDPVSALAVFDDGTGPKLYAGGGVPANFVAKWDGASWTPLGGGVSAGSGSWSWVAALASFDDGSGPALHVGGTFTSAAAFPAHNIAKWQRSAWSSLGGGLSSSL